MSNYILTSDGKLYHCDISESELYHYGVPGMKWGKRKARPVPTGVRPRRGTVQQTSSSLASPEAQVQARKAKKKKALAIGAAVAGTALAAYGAYKITKMVKNKRAERAASEAFRKMFEDAALKVNEEMVRSGKAIRATYSRYG